MTQTRRLSAGATYRQNRNDKRQRELEAENRALRKQLAENL